MKKRNKLHCKCTDFYPNVTTLRSGLCCCYFVCRLSICLSVTLVHSTQWVEDFGNISSPLCTWPSSDFHAKFYGDGPKEPLRRGVKRKSYFRPIEGYIS